MATVVSLDARLADPLHRQLYESVRAAIVGGRLRPGVRLPSTRALAEQLDVSRNTAMTAFDQLLAEGYLVGRAGSGTYVAAALPERATTARRRLAAARVSADARASADGSAATTVAAVAPRSARSAATTTIACPFLPDVPLAAAADHRSLGRSAAVEPMLAFRLGAPDREHFPVEAWGKLLAKRWNRSAADLLGHRDPRGYAPLRRAVCDYVTTARGVRCEPDHVLIVAGTQQGLALTAQVLLDPGQPAWVEDPGYPGTAGALAAAGVIAVPVPVDADGLDVSAGLRLRPDAKLAVVTPAHQFPTGVPLSPERRAALLGWAASAGAWVFEDDYDSEYRYAGRPLPALQGEGGGADRVVYCGTFSKVLSPSLRLAYLVVPPGLADAFIAAKAFADVQCPPLEQAVLADFVAAGHFARHVRKTRVLYARRQALLVEHARRELVGMLDVRPMSAGMHLVGFLPPGTDDRAASRRAWAAGVDAVPLSVVATAAAVPPALLLGYAGVPDDQIAEGVRRLAVALRGVAE